MPIDKRTVEQYDAAYAKMLRERIDSDEALRYKAMKPFRDFVMQNYRIVQPVDKFWSHVLFELKSEKNRNNQ